MKIPKRGTVDCNSCPISAECFGHFCAENCSECPIRCCRCKLEDCSQCLEDCDNRKSK
ncbi:MAG: hypothetical protein ACLU84_03665 [Clostridia bacterium]